MGTRARTASTWCHLGRSPRDALEGAARLLASLRRGGLRWLDGEAYGALPVPRKVFAWAAATAVLALAALPGMVGSAGVPPATPIPDDAFQDLAIGSDGLVPVIRPLDPALRSASYIASDAALVDVGTGPAATSPIPRGRAAARLPQPAATKTWKAPRYTMDGWATWYDNGTTALRLPRGTVVVICGAGGCVERTVTDYGPVAGYHPVRVADLMPSDFVAVCGCALWQGTAPVTVRVY